MGARRDEVARFLIESGADPGLLDDAERSAYDNFMAPDTISQLMDERDRAVATAAAAASIMSGLCGEHSGSLLASFLATPWMLAAADELLTDQPMPEWVAIGAKLRG